MNIPSVSQFCYLAWYILNDDWPLYHGRILEYIKELANSSFLSRFGGDRKLASFKV
jgi:hypothetical protein